MVYINYNSLIHFHESRIKECTPSNPFWSFQDSPISIQYMTAQGNEHSFLPFSPRWTKYEIIFVIVISFNRVFDFTSPFFDSCCSTLELWGLLEISGGRDLTRVPVRIWFCFLCFFFSSTFFSLSGDTRPCSINLQVYASVHIFQHSCRFNLLNVGSFPIYESGKDA